MMHSILQGITGQLFDVTSSEFIIRVKTDNVGTSADNQFTLPINAAVNGYQYNYTVDWGDGSNDTYNSSGNKLHTYATSGVYIIKISGNFGSILFNNGGDRRKLIEISNWGTMLWTKFERSFFGCENLDVTANDTPDLSICTSLRGMFMNCTSLIGNSSFTGWNVSNITIFGGTAGGGFRHGMFYGCVLFNQNLSNWDVSNGTNFDYMFQNSGFNQNLSNWDVSNATRLVAVFRDCPFNYLLNWTINTTTPNMTELFRSTSMSTANYTDTIVYWANYAFDNAGTPINVNMSSQNGMTFDTSRSGGANFATAGDARTYLISTLGWTITSDTVI